MKSTARTGTLIFLLTTLCAITALSIDIYLPAMPGLVGYFHTNIDSVQWSLTIFMFGYAGMQILYGPVSDYYGHKPVLLLALAIYFMASFVCAFSSSMEALILGRLLQALGGCGVVVSAYAMVRDVFPKELNAKVYSYITMGVGFAPLCAPVLGGYLTRGFGWRSNFIFLALISVALFIACLLQLPSKTSAKDGGAHFRSVLWQYIEVLKTRQFYVFIFPSVTGMCGLFGFVASSPLIFMRELGASITSFGWIFAANALMLIFGGYTMNRLHHRCSVEGFILVGGILVFVAGLSLGCVHYFLPHHILMTLLPSMLATFGLAWIMPAAMAGMMAPFSKAAGSASALIGSLRYTAAALLTFFIGKIPDNHILVLSIILLCSGLCSICLMLYAGPLDLDENR